MRIILYSSGLLSTILSNCSFNLRPVDPDLLDVVDDVDDNEVRVLAAERGRETSVLADAHRDGAVDVDPIGGLTRSVAAAVDWPRPSMTTSDATSPSEKALVSFFHPSLIRSASIFVMFALRFIVSSRTDAPSEIGTLRLFCEEMGAVVFSKDEKEE